MPARDRAARETPSGHPSVSAQRAEQLSAFLDAERELGRPHLGQPPVGAQPLDAQRQFAARRHRHAQARHLSREQSGDEIQRGGRASEPLGVVDDDRERVDQQPPQLGQQRPQDHGHVHLLGAGRQPIGERIGDTRHGEAKRVDDVTQQAARIAVGLGAPHPGRGPLTHPQRLLERHRLAEAGGRDDQQRGPFEGARETPRDKFLALLASSRDEDVHMDAGRLPVDRLAPRAP